MNTTMNLGALMEKSPEAELLRVPKLEARAATSRAFWSRAGWSTPEGRRSHSADRGNPDPLLPGDLDQLGR